MKRTSVGYRTGFRVLTGDDHSQAATMVIAPGQSEGSPDNFHRNTDQWLYVESGAGEAIVNGHQYQLKRGALLLIQRGDKHEIRNSGRRPLKTLNFYVPPAYSAGGEELPRGKASST
jgi:mannose-6-phosphate isomerase-like protein (cupin superfamily)